MKFITSVWTAFEAVLFKFHESTREAHSSVALIRVNFDPTQEIGPKVGGGRSFLDYQVNK